MGEAARNVMLGVLACGLLITTLLGWVWTPKRRAGLVRTFQTKHNLLLDPSTRPVAERLLVTPRRGQHVGGMIGFAAMAVFVILGPFTGDDAWLGTLSTLLLFTPVLWLQTLFGAIAVSVAARPDSDAPRVARLPEPRLADYLQRRLRWWGPGAMAVATAVALVYIASPPAGDGWLGRTGAAVGLGLAAFSVVLNEITMRRLLHAPQPASDTSELALRDVIKGEALGELATGIVPTFLAALLLMERFPLGPLFWLPLGVVAVPLVLQRDQRRHMRDHLWPTPVPRPPQTDGPVATESRAAP